MFANPAVKPVLILASLFTAFLVAGFFLVDLYVSGRNAGDAETAGEVTYENHDIATALDYRSDFIGDQGNTFALIGTLPLSENTVLMSVIDDGVRVQLERVNLASRDVQLNMAYTAAALMATISNAEYITFETPQSRVEINRDEVEESLGLGDLNEIGVNEWENVYERIPQLADDTIRVTADQ